MTTLSDTETLVETGRGAGKGRFETRTDSMVSQASNGSSEGGVFFEGRSHPQTSFVETVVEPDSFFGQLRKLFSHTVLKRQLEQMRKSGAYDGFDLKWKEVYSKNRLQGGNWRPEGGPPLIFQECDISTWLEAVCYFLNSPDGKTTPHRAELEACVEETVERIEKAQQPDGYLGIYFTVVDPEGRFMNLRDFHELYEAGHLTEAALAHYHLTGSRRLLNVLIRYVDLLLKTFGPAPDQLHGYCGHPELELAMLRLYGVTHDQRHLDFARFMLEERGQKREDQGGMSYFDWEAKERRKNFNAGGQLTGWNDTMYAQAHAPLHDQKDILGHSVRALYLITAAADIGGELREDAKRLLYDAIDNKMYVTGGVGSEPRSEGFSKHAHHLPQSSAEGGGYNETCASIAVMMVCERLLSFELDGKLRDTMELCLYNNVLGGGSLDGKTFGYTNRLATCEDESASRSEWFDTACCPPNLARTLGMIGGYTWNTSVDSAAKRIDLSIYLYISGTRTIPLPNGQHATVTMSSKMPWTGETSWVLDAPAGWTWSVHVPTPPYARNVQFNHPTHASTPGFVSADLGAGETLVQTFEMPPRLLAPHPRSGQDTLAVSRGPLIFVAESADNVALDAQYPHFEGMALSSSTTFRESTGSILGFEVIHLTTNEPVHGLETIDPPSAYQEVNAHSPARTWRSLETLVFTPWFARGNREGTGHLRTWFLRKD